MGVTCISLFGDSIGKGVMFDETRGRYVIMRDNIMNLLKRNLSIPVENYAIMGSTAADGVKRMTDDALQPGGIAAIEFGGNDCDMPWADIARNPYAEYPAKVPLPDFERLLRTMIERARNKSAEPVLVIPPPLHAQRYFNWVTRTLDPDAILRHLGDVQHIYRWQERYACAVRDIAREEGCRTLDIRDSLLSTRGLDDFYCIDGIHPNERGYKIIADTVMRHLADMLGVNGNELSGLTIC